MRLQAEEGERRTETEGNFQVVVVQVLSGRSMHGHEDENCHIDVLTSSLLLGEKILQRNQ